MNVPKSLIEKLQSSKSIIFFTGAGISAESGIDTFRGKGGLWNNHSAAELASVNGFNNNPDLVWEWYQHRRKKIRETSPNKGHTTIVDFEKLFEDVTVITQNVDALHKQAGSKNVIELHGNIERNYCIDCDAEFGADEFQEFQNVPKCKFCGGYIRPGVVWFGEQLPILPFQQAEKKAKECDVCFVIGTSALVYPAAYIPIAAKENGATIVEINIEPTELTDKTDYSILGKAGKVLPEIFNILTKGEN